jgi:hypothetical protein
MVEGDAGEAALSAVAHAADEMADEERRLAARAQELRRAHRAGRTWSELIDAPRAAGLLVPLRATVRRLGSLVAHLQAVLARALFDEGVSTREIGRRFAVSHQRISSLMSRRDP